MADNVVVKNIGAIDYTASGSVNTAGAVRSKGGADVAFAENAVGGTVRVVLGGIEYVWGPNESKTLSANLAAEAVAADTRLRIADSRDGFTGQARS